MSKDKEFTFGDSSIATSYDNGLVPCLFEPWATQLIADHQPWKGRRVLDLATGTGIVAQILTDEVGPGGQVIGVDINSEMLALAKKRCADSTTAVKFVEGPAYPLEIDSDSCDFVVCQQGLQFFPDRRSAVSEIHRVLRNGGKAVASTWCPVEQCQMFGAICTALETIGEHEISGMMRVPFDLMPSDELVDHFKAAGFANVHFECQERDLVMAGGIAQAIDTVYSTPIAPRLRDLPDRKASAFRASFVETMNSLSNDGVTMGQMVSNVVVADR